MTYRVRQTPCEDCYGCGRTCKVVRIRGEAFDADMGEARCEACDGHGRLDAMCVGCEVVQPLNDDGECERCSDQHDLSIAEFDLKWALTDVRRTGTGVWL